MDEVFKVQEAMGVSSKEKEELAAYNLNNVAHVWYEQWKDSRTVSACSIEWETFKSSFLDRLFPKEVREANLEEFINLKRGHLNVKEYILKFTLLSKYTPSLVANPRDLMNRFMTGVLVEKGFHLAVLVDDMDIS